MARRASLAVRIPGVVLATWTVFVLVQAAVIAVARQRTALDDGARALAAAAPGYARLLAGLPAGQGPPAELLLAEVARSQYVSGVALLDAAGRVRNAHPPLPAGAGVDRLPGVAATGVAARLAAAPATATVARAGPRMALLVPLRPAGGAPGWLVITFDFSTRLAEMRRAELGTLIPVALAGLALAALLALALALRMGRPVARLEAAADRIAGGERGARSGIASGDEIGRAAAAFDRMAERVERTEVELQSARALLDSVLQSLPVGVIVVGRDDLRVRLVNTRWRELFVPEAALGDDYGAHLGRSRLERPDGTPYPREELAVPSVLRDGRPSVHTDLVFVRADGERIPIVSAAVPVRLGGDRDFDAVVSVVQDRRELVRVLGELRASERRYERVALATGQVVFEWDLDHDVFKPSANYAQVLGDAPDPSTPPLPAWAERLHPDDRERVLARHARCVESGEPFDEEYRLRHADGRWLVVHDRRFFDGGDGRPRRVFGTLADVSERHALEAQLRHAQKMETVGTLAGGVAHDFNNQLTGVIGHLDLLAGELPAGDERQQHVEVARRAAERCAELTRGLLAFSRQLVSHPRPTAVEPLVRESVELLARVLPASVRLEADVEPGLPAVLADAVHIQQVLFNLCVNARDAMPSGGRLRVSARAVDVTPGPPRPPEARAGRFIELAVEDEGTGIPADVLPRIFEPFFTTKPVGLGTGLGLAMVYGILQRHQGWVEVKSEPGHGTRFAVLLPVTTRPVAHEPDPGAARAPGAGESVLVVDDEEMVRSFVVSALRGHGYRPLAAREGEEAIELLRRYAADVRLALLDLVMPGMGGVELARRLRAIRPDLRIVFSSGFDPDAGEPPAEGDAFLPKPYALVQLLGVVRGQLAAPRA